MVLEKIFEVVKNGIVDLSNTQITQRDLAWILDELKRNSNIRFINWRENEDVLNSNRAIKLEIQEKIIENLLKLDQLVIDLSGCELDEDFLKCLSDEIKGNRQIGHVIFGEENEANFKNTRSSRYLMQIKDYVAQNNENPRRFPSDYEHCLLASVCQKNDSNRERIWEKLKNDGWEKAEDSEFVERGYMSILFRNDSTRQMVLAFRGVNLEFKDIFFTNSSPEAVAFGVLNQEIVPQIIYAYFHAKIGKEIIND